MKKNYFIFALLIFFACSKKNDTTSPMAVVPSITSFTPDSGSAGTTVTISGTNFSPTAGQNTIKFNGVAATATAASATQLTVIVPAGATSGVITVTVNGRTVTSINSFTILPGSWVQKPDFAGGGRIRAGGFSIGSKGYIIGGTSHGAEPTDFWEYDTATNKWTQKAAFPGGAREYPIAFSIGNKGYVGLGFVLNANIPGFEYQDFWEYNADSDTWVQKNNVPFTGRESAIGFVIDGKGYAGLGTDYTYQTDYTDFWQYDTLSDTWTQKTNFPGTGIIQASAFSLNGKGYVGFGAAGSTQSKELWLYDPSVNTWSRKTDFPGDARQSATAFIIGNKGFIGFGYNEMSNSALGDFWSYDASSDSWAREADFPGTPRYDLVGFSIGNSGYIGTGNNGGLQDFWQFNP